MTNDPTNAALTWIVTTGGPSLATFQDYDTVTALLAGSANEVTNTNYARINLTDADLSAWSPDDTNNRIQLFLDLQTFANIAAGNTWHHLVIAYTPDTGTSTDADRIPITVSEILYNGSFVVPNGDDIFIDFSNGWVFAT